MRGSVNNQLMPRRKYLLRHLRLVKPSSAALRLPPATDGPRRAIGRHTPSQIPCLVPPTRSSPTNQPAPSGRVDRGLVRRRRKPSRALPARDDGVERGPPESGGQHPLSCPRNPAVQAGFSAGSRRTKPLSALSPAAASTRAKRETVKTPGRIQRSEPKNQAAVRSVARSNLDPREARDAKPRVQANSRCPSNNGTCTAKSASP
jgi:hypothetical protein